MPGFENQWGLHLGELKGWVKLRLYLLKGSHTNLPASSPRTVAIAWKASVSYETIHRLILRKVPEDRDLLELSLGVEALAGAAPFF